MVAAGSALSVQALQRSLDVSPSCLVVCCCCSTCCRPKPISCSTAGQTRVMLSSVVVLQEALRQLLASGAPSIQEQIVPTLTAVLPQAMGNEVRKTVALTAPGRQARKQQQEPQHPLP